MENNALMTINLQLPADRDTGQKKKKKKIMTRSVRSLSYAKNTWGRQQKKKTRPSPPFAFSTT